MKKIFLLTFCLFLFSGAFARTAVIYHTSDTHGFFFPKNGQGGAAALAAVLRSGPKEYLLLDGGDFAEGTVETKNSKGLKAVELMNRMGYHAATLGNHEFAYRDDGLKEMLSRAEFAVLAANFFERESGLRPENTAPYRIFSVNGVKIAVVGLANRNPTVSTKKYTFSKPLEALENALSEAEKQEPSAVVVLVHDSLADDRPGDPNYVGDIGRKYAGRVHAVLGGHAHKVIQNRYIKGVLFAESGSNFRAVSKITLTTDDKTGKLIKAQSELIALDPSVTGTDKETEAFAESLREPGVDEVVGVLREPISKKSANPAFADTPADNWVADVGRAYSGADVFISNTGGVRVGLNAGEVTRRDLIDFFPFDDEVVNVEVDGRFLRSLVKNALLPWNRLCYSGLKLTYREKNGKVKNLKIWINGRPLRNGQKYVIGTNSYIAGGGSEGKAFKTIPAENKKQIGEKTIRGLLEEALGKGAVSAPETGRIKRL